MSVLFSSSSFISYTMAVIAVNFVVPLSVMFYCYYNVSVTVKRYKASSCLDSVNTDWSDQMDVTKVTSQTSRTMSLYSDADCPSLTESEQKHCTRVHY